MVPRPKLVIFAAFQFDPKAARDIDETKWPGVMLLKAQMNADLLTDDLKKKRASNESFWLIGQPDVRVLPSPGRRGAGGEVGNMINEQTLQDVVARIVAAAQPSRVILFGSYGRGDADAGSDLDLIVIERNVDNRYGEMIRLHNAVGHIGVGVDVLVYSETEYERRSQVPGTVLYWARKEGTSLYEAAH